LQPQPSTLLGGLSVAAFLREHWQRKPLLIRGAFPGFVTPLEPEELAGLACEPEVESRLVSGTDYALRHGPFVDADFTSLPERDWTLLVQDCDKHLPELASLLDPFRFIPDWRIDDLMISYAAPGGGVGPHVDQYDVFLLQAHGRRRWRIADLDPAWRERPGLDLRVLDGFVAEQEWVLEPGDMLYLPPGVAHDGVALDACMTFSIGFRAPSDRELVSDLAEWLYQRVPEDERYADAGLSADAAQPAGRIDAAALAALRARVRTWLTPDDAALDAWFGAYITEPKQHLRPEPADQPLEPEVLRLELRDGARLERDLRSRFNWQEHDGAITLFADGTALPLPGSARGFCVRLCSARTHGSADLDRALDDPVTRAALATLYAQGSLRFSSDE
jgi:50S ribosomal protein L16 3-hydroxylase